MAAQGSPVACGASMSHVPETEPSLPPPRPASFAPPAAVDGAPPVTERDGNQGLMSAQPSAMAIHYAGTPAARRRTLTSGWRWVLACGWGTVMAGIGVIANTGFILGDPPFWTGNGLAVLPFVAPVVVLVALAADWRY